MNEPAFSLTPFSWIILALTIAASIYAFRNARFRDAMLLYPVFIAGKKQYHRLLTYGFIHGDVMHLLFNMFALFSITFALEQVMGTLRLATLYLASMVMSAAIPAWKQRANVRYSALGASGAVSALFFSGMLYFPTAKVMILFLPIPLPWPVFAILFVVISILGNRRKWGNIGHDVHLYGAASGLLLTIAMDPRSVQIFLTGVGMLFSGI
jgi:membrane associated rhomboid family serine protease